ncbi:hypothetical protein J5839_04425 [Methanosarcinaceae archaeon]|jgi:hypothetical protein|nr:hypothetical protein [Methanosarcinaceae archaeon]MBQ3620308.1 hypothetical protein [Methanosarcinaceae archaeon]
MQTEAALAAYSDMWADAVIPYSEYLWMIIIIITALSALYMARRFVTTF